MALDLKQQTRKLFDDVWNAGKLDSVNEYFDSGYRGVDPVLGSIDRDGFRTSVKEYREAFPNLKFEVNEVICEGEAAAVRWTATGTHRGALMGLAPTGKTASVGGITVMEYRRGKVVRDQTQWDVLGLYRQLGVETMAPVGAGPQKVSDRFSEDPL